MPPLSEQFNPGLDHPDVAAARWQQLIAGTQEPDVDHYISEAMADRSVPGLHIGETAVSANYERKHARVRKAVVAFVGASALLLTGCAASNAHSAQPAAHSSEAAPAPLAHANGRAASTHVTVKTVSHAKDIHFGLYESENSTSYAQVKAFGKASVKPASVIYYSGWGESFQTSFAETAYAHGSTVFAELQPNDAADLSDMARNAPADKQYLTRFAEAIKQFRHPVQLTFAHEMNGSWYPWGKKSPAEYIAAWRNFVRDIRPIAPNASFVWAPNVDGPGIRSLKEYWPGKKFISRVGLDGYEYSQHANFRSVFGASIAAVRKLTSEPIEIAETGINGNQAPRIADLFANARALGITAIYYFDKNKAGKNWKLTHAGRLALVQACKRDSCV